MEKEMNYMARKDIKINDKKVKEGIDYVSVDKHSIRIVNNDLMPIRTIGWNYIESN